MKSCDKCKTRLALARVFGAHIDWRDCPYECEYADVMEMIERVRKNIERTERSEDATD